METPDLPEEDESLNKDQDESISTFDIPPLNFSGNLDFERRGSTDSITSLRPSYKQKFKTSVAKPIMQQVLKQRLNDALYDKDQAPGWAHEISQEVKQKLIDLELSRYKYVVNVTIMENKCAGVRIKCSCAWDADADSLAHETFRNDSVVCTIMVFGVCFYS